MTAFVTWIQIELISFALSSWCFNCPKWPNLYCINQTNLALSLCVLHCPNGNTYSDLTDSTLSSYCWTVLMLMLSFLQTWRSIVIVGLYKAALYDVIIHDYSWSTMACKDKLSTLPNMNITITRLSDNSSTEPYVSRIRRLLSVYMAALWTTTNITLGFKSHRTAGHNVIRMLTASPIITFAILYVDSVLFDIRVMISNIADYDGFVYIKLFKIVIRYVFFWIDIFQHCRLVSF